MKKDQNYVVKVEQAISKKYGVEAIQNPKGNWDQQKEKEYLEQLKRLAKQRDKKKVKSEKVEQDGVLIDKKLLNKREDRVCPVCRIYSFEIKDDLYMNRYHCCYKCYIEFIYGREERWENSWRPSQDEVKERRFKKNN